MSDVDQLIMELSLDVKPVRRLLPSWMRLGIWIVFATLCLLAGSYYLGLRSDLLEQLKNTTFLLQLLLAGATVVLSASSAITLSVPGAERGHWTRFLPLLVLAVWTLWMLYRMVSFIADPGIWLMVIREYTFEEIGSGIALASLPGFVLFLMVRRAAPLRPSWTGGLAMIAAGSLSTMTGLLTCDSPCPIHAVVLHLTPMLCFGLFGIGAGWALLRHFR